jgi:hypothetical protein
MASGENDDAKTGIPECAHKPKRCWSFPSAAGDKVANRDDTDWENVLLPHPEAVWQKVAPEANAVQDG